VEYVLFVVASGWEELYRLRKEKKGMQVGRLFERRRFSPQFIHVGISIVPYREESYTGHFVRFDIETPSFRTILRKMFDHQSSF